MLKNTVIIGAQWGDEGKAKITDLLASNADVIIRYQGGCNAGHTVVNEKGKYKFHLVPSGVLYENKLCVIGAGCVIHPESLEKEILDLLKSGINLDNLKIHPLASITMPYHIDLDGASEENSKENKIGTTKKGIGPTYSDKVGRLGIKVQDLYDDNEIESKIEKILPLKNEILKIYSQKPYTKEQIVKYCKRAKEIIEPYLFKNWQEVFCEIKKEEKKVLFEGAQGVMLDIDWGTYPYVTSSNAVAGGASTGTGFGPTNIQNVIGVFKAYITRVGEGPFVTELTDETGKKIQEIGKEYGTTTGRARRCGWFDAVIAKYCVMVGGITEIALTKADIFDNFKEIKICTAYKNKKTGEIYKNYPTNISIHKYLEPIYETIDGWEKSISEIKEYEELPLNFKQFIKKVEDITNVKVTIISTGAKREETIIIKNPFY